MRVLRLLLAALPLVGGVDYSRILTSGTANFPITAMASAPNGSVVVVGTTIAPDLPGTANAFQPQLNAATCVPRPVPPGTINPPAAIQFPCSDVFIVKLDAKGDIVFATYLGGNGSDIATSVALDSSGNVYVAGYTSVNDSPIPPINFPTTPGALYTKPSDAPVDAFVAKLNPTGSKLIYSTLIPALYAPQIAVDSQGKVYLTARTVQIYPGNLATSGAYETTQDQSFIAKLNATGSAFEYATYFPEYVSAPAIDAQGDAFLTGIGFGYPTTDGSTPPNHGSVWIGALNPAGTGLVYGTLFGGTLTQYRYDSGNNIRLDAEGNVYVMGGIGTDDFPLTPGAFRYPADGAPHGSFIAKLKPGGNTIVYAAQFSDARAFDVDQEGNVYIVTAETYGFPTTGNASRRCMAGGASDLLVAKLAPDGTLAEASYLGGSGTDGTASFIRDWWMASDPGFIAVSPGPDGSVFVAGGTDSPDFPGAQGQRVNALSNFIARFRISDPENAGVPCLALTAPNSANLIEGPVVPGELVTLRGMGIGPDAGVAASSGDSIATTLAGVRVFFDNLPAPILYAQSQQVNVQAPFEIAGPVTRIRVEYNGQSSDVSPVAVVPLAPALVQPDIFSGEALALNEDGTWNSLSNPAPRGSVVTLWGTGGGQFNPTAATGSVNAMDPSGSFAQTAHVGIGNFLPREEAEIVYAGPAPGASSGAFQISFRIPSDLKSDITFLNVTVGDAKNIERVYDTWIVVKIR